MPMLMQIVKLLAQCVQEDFSLPGNHPKTVGPVVMVQLRHYKSEGDKFLTLMPIVLRGLSQTLSS